MTKGIRFKAKCLWEMIWLFRVISNLMLSKSEHFQIVTITYLQMLQKYIYVTKLRFGRTARQIGEINKFAN